MHPINVRTRFLPFLSCIWSANNLVIAAVSWYWFYKFASISSYFFLLQGHDCCPMLYYYDDYSGEIRFIDKVDKSTKKETDGFRWVLVLCSFYSLLTLLCCCSAMRKFRDLDKRAIVESTVSNTALDTIHQNTISEIRLFDQKQTKADKITSVGVDGQMVIWDLKVSWSICANWIAKLTDPFFLADTWIISGRFTN